MFPNPPPLVGLTLSCLLVAQCLAFPLEDADDARFLHVRQIVSSTVASNTSTTTTNTMITATAPDSGAIVAGNVLAALADISSASNAAHFAVIATQSGNGILQLACESSCSSTSAPAAATGAVGLSAITIKPVQPSLCTTSILQYSTKTAIPTGQVQIFPDQTAFWGTTGSIWNFTLDDGVEFSTLTASCQGSLCTSGQAEQSGSIVKNPDGVWTLNVTANMQQAITVFGVTSGGDPVNGKFDLTITSTPPCALPVAQSCISSSFDPSASQWAAYSTDDWLADYVSTNSIQTFKELYGKATGDFLKPTQTFNCEPGFNPYSCQPPAAELADCNSTQGFLVVWGVMRISNALDFLWDTLDTVQGDVSRLIPDLVDLWIVPSVKQKWESIVTAASSIVGVLVFIFILIDALSGPEAAPATGIAVALIVGTTNIIGAVANFANGFTTTPPDDTYLKYEGYYQDFDTAWIGYMQDSLTGLWTPSNGTSFGATAVENGLKDGAWTNVLNPFSVSNLDQVARIFFRTILLDSIANSMWKSNGYYIVFVPYGHVGDFQNAPGRSTTNITFTIDDCNNHWANDPKRTNYISCSLNHGGEAGMTVLAQPSSVGGTRDNVLKNYTSPTGDYTFVTDYALQSSLTGNALYGPNYNLTTTQMHETLTSGAYNLSANYAIPPDTPGLFNVDVCVVTQLSYVPGAREYLIATNGVTKVTFNDPCTCSSYSSHGVNFVDYATEPVAAAVSYSNESNQLECTQRYIPDFSNPVYLPG